MNFKPHIYVIDVEFPRNIVKFANVNIDKKIDKQNVKSYPECEPTFFRVFVNVKVLMSFGKSMCDTRWSLVSIPSFAVYSEPSR